jgi:sarcosine oxidase subunit gamma
MRDSAGVHIGVVDGRSVWQLKTWLRAPLAVGEISAAFGGLALGIGPQEWLVVGDAHQLGREPIARDVIAVDITDAFAVLEVQGDSARELLSRGCGLDLHPRMFRVGQCARTRFAQIPVVLTCVDHSHRFELYVARSYASYLRSWLVDAASTVR